MQRPKYESKQLNNLIKQKTLKATCKAKYGPDAEEAYDTNYDTCRWFPNSLQEVCLSRQLLMRSVFSMNMRSECNDLHFLNCSCPWTQEQDVWERRRRWRRSGRRARLRRGRSNGSFASLKKWKWEEWEWYYNEIVLLPSKSESEKTEIETRMR